MLEELVGRLETRVAISALGASAAAILISRLFLGDTPISRPWWWICGALTYAGRIVILNWTNDGCPFVGKHYNSGNMQTLQRRYTGEGDVWLTIASSAPGEQGYVTPAEAKADLARWHSAPTDYLLDPNGVVGRLYDARATPTMVVVNRDGRVAYIGAIDDTPSTRLADVKPAKNYVVAALNEIAARQAGHHRRHPRLRLLDQV